VNISKADKSDVFSAIASDFYDFEDALISAVAAREKADFIITRNKKDFKNSKVPAASPEEFLAQ
jgi:predicted nucleic acid-binding protein